MFLIAPALRYAHRAVRSPADTGRENLMAFMFRLEGEDGAPADPATFRTAISSWHPGDTIPLGRKTLRVVNVRDEDADQAPVLVVENADQSAN
jgi:hypothetical protein